MNVQFTLYNVCYLHLHQVELFHLVQGDTVLPLPDALADLFDQLGQILNISILADLLDQLGPDSFAQDDVQDRLVGLRKTDGGVEVQERISIDYGVLGFLYGVFYIWDSVLVRVYLVFWVVYMIF